MSTDLDAFLPDKTIFKDEAGRYRTQSLFVEFGYEVDKAVYSMADEHKTYKGVVYPSLKRLYMNMADPTEYLFATTYFNGWDHWQRIKENKTLSTRLRLDDWAEELELKLRAEAIRQAIKLSGDNFNASKWVADGSWRGKKAGRPKKEETERERAMRKKAVDETAADASRVVDFIRKTK